MASHSLSLHLSKFSRNSFSVMKPSKLPSSSKKSSPMAASSTLELESNFLNDGYEIVFFWSGSRVLRQFRPDALRHAGVDPAAARRVLLLHASDDLRRGPDGRRARGDGLEDDGAGAELCPVAHPNIAEHGAARAEQHVLADLRMP